MEQCFTHIEKIKSKISFSRGSFPKAKIEYFAYIHPSCAIVQGPCHLVMEGKFNLRIGQVSYDTHVLSRDNRIFIEHKAERTIPTLVINLA